MRSTIGALALLTLVSCSSGCSTTTTVAPDPVNTLLERVYERTDDYLSTTEPLVDVSADQIMAYQTERQIFRNSIANLPAGERLPGATLRAALPVTLELHDAFVQADPGLTVRQRQDYLRTSELLRRAGAATEVE